MFALSRDSGTLMWSDCVPDSSASTEYQSGPTSGVGAGSGLLVVPSGRYLVAYESRPGAPAYICSGTQPMAGPTQPVGGGGTSGSGAAGVGAQASSVTMSARKRSITFGQVVTLRGKATPGAQVQLQSDAFPTAGFAPRKSVTATSDGSFSFRVRPDRNTAFKAVAAGAQSAATVVYVDVAGRVRHRVMRHRRTRVTSLVVGPRDLP